MSLPRSLCDSFSFDPRDELRCEYCGFNLSQHSTHDQELEKERKESLAAQDVIFGLLAEPTPEEAANVEAFSNWLKEEF